MIMTTFYFMTLIVSILLNEDVELRRIFPSEFPQDTVRKSGSVDAEHLGRYVELEHYFKYPKSKLSSHFEELTCYEENGRKLVIFALVAAACAAPQNQNDVQIVRYDSDNSGLGAYSFAWELSDGSKHEEQGQLQNQGTVNEGIAVQGQYSWVGPDGVTYIVRYIADDKGFQPTIEQGPGGAVPGAVVASLLG
ncbi:hypothetical protein MSG28_007505 [Choristoneura fumiferana]|uniref:Uncharacterized protein n=1 Tax=Choristoneura fumiferana TaxID=7141 RepID=A0ACC0JX97_CHOFU|nr:hypothetical protein MSG28_007505 [Choristoneura fumiferana]